ncbi:MAG: protein kinase, partial [Phycisphaerae bacterium]
MSESNETQQPDCPDLPLLEEHVRDESSDASLAAHINACDACRCLAQEIRDNLRLQRTLQRAHDSDSGETMRRQPSHQPIRGFTITSEVGRGGMGIVYLARQQHPERDVAIKVIRGDPLKDERRARLFDREVRALGRLKHASIAAIHEAGNTDDGDPYFVMEWVDGAPLHDYLEREQPSLESRLQLFRQICDGIEYA